jgi:hypothetical protein
VTFTPVTRNQAFDALIALTLPTIAGKAFSYRSRKFKHFDKVGADIQPALFQTEIEEKITQRNRMPSLRIWRVNWTVYFSSDPGDDDDMPAVAMNDFMDALEAVFPDAGDEMGGQTLGGLVDHCWIDGDVLKVAGDDDGQGMMVIPITIQAP